MLVRIYNTSFDVGAENTYRFIVYDLQIKNAHAHWMPKYAQNEGLLAPISFKSAVIQSENTGKY